MKCQILFSWKNKKNVSKCHLLRFLPSMLSVRMLYILHYYYIFVLPVLVIRDWDFIFSFWYVSLSMEVWRDRQMRHRVILWLVWIVKTHIGLHSLIQLFSVWQYILISSQSILEWHFLNHFIVSYYDRCLLCSLLFEFDSTTECKISFYALFFINM